MTKQSEVEERQRDSSGEENFSNARWQIGKGILHAANDNVLERRGVLNKRRLLVLLEEPSVSDEGVR